MKIAIVSATSFEIDPILHHMDRNGRKASFFHYEYNGHEVYPLVTGIGAMKMAFALGRFSESSTLDIAINAGLGGSYNRDVPLGSVVQVVSDRFGDLGVEENNGEFTDIYDLELEEKNRFPYTQGAIINDSLKYTFDINETNGITVNKVHGTQESIDKILAKYPDAQVESMEGAGFLYACKIMDIQHIQLRAISNYVEPRNKNHWEIELAIEKLNETLINLLDRIENLDTKTAAFNWF